MNIGVAGSPSPAGRTAAYWKRSLLAVRDRIRSYPLMPPPNAEVTLETDLDDYPRALDRRAERFDIIVVDGAARGRTRLTCARVGGLTSLFFERTFNVPPPGDRQPIPGRGAQLMNWEPPFVPVPGGGHDVSERNGFEAPLMKPLSRSTRAAAASVRSGRSATLGATMSDASPSPTPIASACWLTRHLPVCSGLSLPGEIARITCLSWPDFCTFVNNHPMRRYMVRQ